MLELKILESLLSQEEGKPLEFKENTTSLNRIYPSHMKMRTMQNSIFENCH